MASAAQVSPSSSIRIHNYNSSSSTSSKNMDNSSNNNSSSSLENKPKKRICCACPDTKKLRDECITVHGEDACKKWIDAHLACLRAEGFKV